TNSGFVTRSRRGWRAGLSIDGNCRLIWFLFEIEALEAFAATLEDFQDLRRDVLRLVPLFFHFLFEAEGAEMVGFKYSVANHLGQDGNCPAVVFVKALLATDFAGDFPPGNKGIGPPFQVIEDVLLVGLHR